MNHQEYFQHYPLMSRDKTGLLDGNAVLYAGTFSLLMFRLNGEYSEAATHEADLYDSVRFEPGVITRGKHKWFDAQAHDDYIGLCTLSGLSPENKAAKEIYAHGKANGWFYAARIYTIRHAFNAIFWRMPGVVQHIKRCAGVKWSKLDHLIFSLKAISNSFTKKEDTSGKILTWHYVTMYERSSDRSFIGDFAARLWKKKILKTYPMGMSDVFRIYYGPDHFFTENAKGVI